MADRIDDRQIYEMMHPAEERDDFHFSVWRDSVDPHERVRWFAYYLKRRFSVRDHRELDQSSVWLFMTQDERDAFNQLCDDREAYCDRLAASKTG